MKKTSIILFTAIFGLISVGLAIFLYFSISGPIKERKLAIKKDELTIRKLKFIREAELLHLASKGVYTNKKKGLINFILKDVLYNIDNKEQIVSGDSSYFIPDTLGTTPVRDSLLKGEYKNYDVAKMFNIEGEKDSISLFVGKMEAVSKEDIYAIMCEAPYKSKVSNKILSFGSKSSVETKGNW